MFIYSQSLEYSLSSGLLIHASYKWVLANNRKLKSHILIESGKLALKNGELGIAEQSLANAIRKEKLEKHSRERNPEPYFYLAEVLEKKAEKDDRELLQKQRLLLQAAALYNFVNNCMKISFIDDDFSKKMTSTIPRKLIDIQNSLVSEISGNPVHCHFDPENRKKDLKQIRNKVRDCLESLDSQSSSEKKEANEGDLRKIFIEQTTNIRNLCKTISSEVKQFLAQIIKECLEVLGDPPCQYEVLVLGSLARDEMTPYSDIEWAILTSSENEECKVFFRNLTNLVHLQVINLGETILPSMGIKALSGEWFYDDITPRGVSFDGFLPQACKTPLGNMKDFELIHSPAEMANFQSNLWYEKNPGLGEILLTVTPLESDKHLLVDEYKLALQTILGNPCDFDNCHHEILTSKRSTRAACRGIKILRQDVFSYGEMITGRNPQDDGKLYDVKKEIYRLTDRVVAGLAKCFAVVGNGTFEVLDELHKKGIISSIARDNLASAAGIALKLRINTYLEAGKQGELIKSNEDVATSEVKSVYRMPREKELFHFFYVTIPLYEELHRFCNVRYPRSFTQDAFFDCSDVVKGHIYCRLLNYTEGLQCYDRALEANQEDVKLELCRIRVEFITNTSGDTLVSIKSKMNTLLRRICRKCNLPEETVCRWDFDNAELDKHCALVKEEDRQLLWEILFLTSAVCQLEGNLETARLILNQCMALENVFDFDELQVLTRKLASLKVSLEQDQPETITSQLSVLIENEGVCTKSIVWLNELAQILLAQGKHDKAYRCLQRALSMGRTLFDNNPNFNLVGTLMLLGQVSLCLLMYEESKFYFEEVLEMLPLSGGPGSRLMKKIVYWQLALILNNINLYEEAVSHSQKGLDLTSNETKLEDSLCNTLIHCSLATSWFTLGATEKAWISASDARECLKCNVGAQIRASMTCFVAQTFAKMGRNEEAISLLEQGREDFDSHDEVEFKALYLSSLGDICVQNGLTSDAERYYTEGLELLKIKKVKISGIVRILVCISNILRVNGKSSEAKCKLNEARNHASTMTNNDEKCVLMGEMGKCWEKLGDINNARKCYQEGLTACREVISRKVPLFEFDLYTKLGDLAKYVSNDDDITLSQEQRHKAQQIQYDRAGEVLRQHSASGNFNSTTILLFKLLASKYRSIDLAKQEELLLEALRMSEAVYTSNEASDMVASILIEMSDFYFDQQDYPRASDFLVRSLKMEMELHSSDPYHPHMTSQISGLSYLSWANPGSKQLDGAIQCVLELYEGGQKEAISTTPAAKADAANCFTSMSFLLLSLGDFEKAWVFNQVASEIFEALHKNDLPKDKILKTAICETINAILARARKTPEFASIFSQLRSVGLLAQLFHFKETDRSTSIEASDIRNHSELRSVPSSSFSVSAINGTESAETNGFNENVDAATIMNELQPTSYPANKELLNSLTRLASENEGKFLSETFSIQSEDNPSPSRCFSKPDGNPGKSLCNMEQNESEKSGFKMAYDVQVDDMNVPSTSTCLQRENLREKSDVIENNSSQQIEGKEELAEDNDQKRLQDLETDKSTMDTLNVVTDSIIYDLKEGDIQQAGISTEHSFNPLIKSVIEKYCPDPVEFFISEAIKNMEGKKSISMLPYLVLAAEYPSNDNRKAQISKLRAECYLNHGNYRMAAISFIEAAGYRSSDTTPDGFLEYTEICINLTKSHVLCNDVEAAWSVCQEAMALTPALEHGVMRMQQETKLFYLGAKIMMSLSGVAENQDENLEKAVSFCEQCIFASKNVDQLRGSRDMIDELGGTEQGELFALKCEIQLLLATALLRLNKPDHAVKILKEMNEFLGNIAVVLETFSKDTWPGSEIDFFTIRRRLFSWIGRARVMYGDANHAISPLMESLSVFFINGVPELMPLEQEYFLALLDAITTTNELSPQTKSTPFQQTIQLCKEMFLEQHDDLKELLRFLETLQKCYVDCERTEDAITVNEIGLAVAECMVDSTDERSSRSHILLYLACCHRRQAINNTGKGTVEERRSAEKYYKTGRVITEPCTVLRGVSYTDFLCEEGRFQEAIAVMEQVIKVDEKLWGMLVTCSYSSRLFYHPGSRKYMEDHGKLFTTIGNLAYSTLVRVYVGLGMKEEAVAACEKLSKNGYDVNNTPFGKRPAFMPYLLGSCHKMLLSLLGDQEYLQLHSSDFPLSARYLAQVYYELNVYELSLEYCEKALISAGPQPCEPTECSDWIRLALPCLRTSGNALVSLGRENESYSHFILFLESVQRQEGILDKPFDAQLAILAQYTFALPYYVYRSLGMLLCRQGSIDGTIQVYEHCLDLDQDYNCDQNLVATLAELYQSKALVTPEDDKATYTKWMNKAKDCFQKLLQTKRNLTPFVEMSFGSLLCRVKDFEKAIFHFQNVLQKPDEITLSFGSVDKPLVGVYLEREIKARGNLVLPLRIYAFHDTAKAYMKINEVEKAQELAFQMEEYVSIYESTPAYPLIFSVLGYTHKVIGNDKKAIDIFRTVLEMHPGHEPVTLALESCKSV